MANEHVDIQNRSKFAAALEEWLRLRTFRAEREYLEKEEKRQLLLDDGCFQLLDKLIYTSSTQTIKANVDFDTAEFRTQKREELRKLEKARVILNHYYAILKDIRRRANDGDERAVENAYINTHGGLTVVELPPFLQRVEKGIETLQPAAKKTSSQKRDECRKLLQEAIKELHEGGNLEPYSSVKDVTRVELYLQLISIPPLRIDKAVLIILENAYRTYTPREYPQQHARVRRLLGDTLVEIFNNDNTQWPQLIDAIQHYNEALKIYKASDHLAEQAIRVETSLLDTHSFLLLLTHPEKSLDELVADSCQLEDRLHWPGLDDTLRKKVIEVCRSVKARISYALAQERRFAESAALLEQGCRWRLREFMVPFDEAIPLKSVEETRDDIQKAVQTHSAHVLVYLVATSRGGFAAIASSNRFASPPAFNCIPLPALTDKMVATCMERAIKLEDSPHPKVVGGFSHALNQAGEALFIKRWEGKTLYDRLSALKEAANKEYPKTSAAQILIQAVEATLDTLSQALGLKPLSDQLATLRETVTADQPAAQAFKQTIEDNLNTLITAKPETFSATLNGHFLRLEVEHIFATFDTALRPLIEHIFELSKAGIREVTLIPYGSLAAIPLANVLEDVDTPVPQGRLGNLVTFGVVQSVQSLLHTPTSAPPSRSATGVSALGDPLQSQRPGLLWSQAQALILKEEAYHFVPAVAKTRSNATKAWLKNALEQSAVVEVGCHCTLDIEAPLQSKLFLENEKELVLHELVYHSINAEGLRLFILAPCKIEIPGERELYDEAQGFTGVLLQAGMKAVLASYWNFSDEANFLLLRYFAQKWFPYMHEKQPAMALYEAKTALRNVTKKELIREAESFQKRLLEDDITNRYVTDFNVYRAYERIHLTASQKNSPERPYADPIYWAGFQIFGW